MYEQALGLLRRSLNNQTADFREGQWDAIRQLVEDRARLLVVQRTGWGKSVVYFLATRLLRERGAGPTLLVSPLLALMRNQVDAALRIGVRAETINSTNVDEWAAIERKLRAGAIDVLLISPERLANEAFRHNVLTHIADRVGLFVVDEAHCISDWGHDFRPDYRRIVRILRQLPPNVPVLATTATANARVVADVVAQLGDGVGIVRGPLGRASLRLQATVLPHPAERLAWLAEHLPQIEGSGVVYARTVRDALRVTAWLQSRGIDTRPYYGAQPTEEREALEARLQGNNLKALVATSALGMGFDKPDLGFVVHYQRPGSVVAYYQQVGRAGRAVDDAYGILLSGDEDDEITDYFIRSAFPPAEHVEAVLKELRAAEGGLKPTELETRLNLSAGQIGKVLKVLDVLDRSPVARQNGRWVATANPYTPDREHVERLADVRRREQDELRRYMAGRECLMVFLREKLDDAGASPCGRCAVCKGGPLLREKPNETLVQEATDFLKKTALPLEPRKLRPDRKRIPEERQAQEGRALSFYKEPGWGRQVWAGKYQTTPARFGDGLVEACAELVRKRWQPEPTPRWVTCVPSLREPTLVPDFAERLALLLGIPFVAAVQKTRETAPQKEQANSHYRLENLRGAFAVDMPSAHRDHSVLLIDDMVDSGWTFTLIAALLREAGSGPVFPLALSVTTGD